MSRSGYSDDQCGEWSWICWRGRIASATRGRRGQKFFRDLLSALDAMPAKRLIAYDLIRDGEVCAIGSLGKVKGVDLQDIDPEDHSTLGDEFDIAASLVQEVEYMNDEYFYGVETPEGRFIRMRAWVADQIRVSV